VLQLVEAQPTSAQSNAGSSKAATSKTAPAQPAINSADVERCALLRHHGDPDARACYQRLAGSSDLGIRAEGLWGAGDFKTANDVFRAAVKLHDKDPNLRVRWGRMYLEHWQPADAEDLFKEALEIDAVNPPALLGLALVASEGFESKAIELAKKALEGDPKLFEARELIARVELEDNKPDKAAEDAEKALAISPEALDALSILATIDWMNDKPTSPWMDRISKINPVYGKAYETAGHFFVINRRYEEGIRYYRKAIELEPSLSSARSQLGINLMRLGQEDEARQQLEQCFEAGYKDNQTVNTLRLLDSYKNYVTFKTPTTVVRLNKKEADLLRPYFQSELDRALKTYEEKYKYKLKAPVQIEVYPDHEDFAVRTMGMPGLGALGVTFGTYVAMDSPSSRKPGSFHWASTMWHELSHVYVLSMTNHRVPRWFTEGLAVYEETANGHPDWGDRLDPESISAIHQKKLLPVADLDRGFIHPEYPSQVTVSYFQAGKICDFIAEKWGHDHLLAMIHDFGELKTTPETIELEFKIKPEEFDRQFLAWLDAQTQVTVNGFEEWRTKIKLVSEMVKAKKWDDAIKQGEAIRDLYPDYVELGNVYEFLSQAWLAKGDKAKATAELELYSKTGGRDPATLKQLASLEVEQGRKREAAAALDRLNLIYPEDADAHHRLGDLDLELGNPNGAVREFQAVLATKPLDMAGAHYELARAFQAAHRLDDARDEVVSSLEAAPSYKPAQKLLLELNVKE